MKRILFIIHTIILLIFNAYSFYGDTDTSTGATSSKNTISLDDNDTKTNFSETNNTKISDNKTQINPEKEKIIEPEKNKEISKKDTLDLENRTSDTTTNATSNNKDTITTENNKSQEKTTEINNNKKAETKEIIDTQDTITSATDTLFEFYMDEIIEKRKDMEISEEKKEEKKIIEDKEEKYDAFAEATDTTDILDLTKKEKDIKEDEKDKFVEIKKNDKEKDSKEEKKNIIEIKDTEKETDEDRSTMIIFKDEYDPYMADEYEYEYEKLEDIKKKSKPKNFKPETVEEFKLYKPELLYDKNQVLLPSGITIDDIPGEKIFYESYTLFKSNDLLNSCKNFEKLIYFNYRLTESYYYLSWCYFLSKKYNLSIKYMEKAIYYGVQDNISSEILSDYTYQIGNIHFQLNNYIDSITYFKKAIETDANSLKSYNKLGISYYKMNNTKSALEIWEKGMNLGDELCKKNYLWLKNK